MTTPEADRKNLLKQMKVRTKYKKDKSWIHQQGSEDERDEIPSPLSPQLKSLEGRHFTWSPTPESKAERNSGTFTVKEAITASPSPTVQASNKQFIYSSTEPDKSQSATSQPSPPPSTTGGKMNPSYIIRGQPFNAISPVKNPSYFNGYQMSYSTVQPRTSSSLPRVPTATGHKMSTEEYKKLAPYNVRNRSVDLSDDEEPTMQQQQQQATRTEQASSVLRNTSPRDRSYVISAAKRNSGIGTQDTTSPFVAKRVQIQDEETSPTKKSQTLPKSLSSYLYDDNMRAENHWKETQSKPTTPQTTPSGVTDRCSSPILTSYSTSNSAETQKSTIKPEPAKITVVREESGNTKGNVTKPAAEKEIPANAVTATRKERVETTKKSDALPESLASYMYNDVNRFEKNLKSNPPTQATSQTVNTRVETTKKGDALPESLASYLYDGVNRVETTKKSDALPESLASYMYNDVNRFEKNLKSNPPTQATSQTVNTRVETTKKGDALPESLASYLYDDVNRFEKSKKSKVPTQSTPQTVTTKVTERPESPKLTSWSTNNESRISAVKPEPGKITVLRDESETSNPNLPRLSSSTTERSSSNMQSGPGKITVLREERHDTNKDSPNPSVEIRSTTRTTESKEAPDFLKLTSSSLSTKATENTQPNVQAGPGKITVIRGESNVGNNGVSNRTTEITTTTTRAKVTIETIKESTSPKPARRMEAKPTEAAAATRSDNQQDLIFWSDLDKNTNTRVSKERSVTPTPVPRQTNKDSEKPAGEPPLIIISPELKSHRTNQPSKPGVITTVDETKVNENRYRVSESLDEPRSDKSNNQSPSGSRQVTVVTSETQSERPKTPEQRSSSPRPTPRPRETTTVTESRYRVPEILETTMLEEGPSRSSSRTTVATTRSTDPVYTEYLEESDKGSARTISSSREKITRTTTTTETLYENASSSEASQYDPQSSNNKGVLFVKEYVNSRESLKSPTASGSIPDFSDDFDRASYSSSSSYLYSSAPQRSDDAPCTYCGREIKDCPKIILEHLNIHCHEYCFKCGICNKPMGDLVDSLFIHRDVVHCESCYEKLF